MAIGHVVTRGYGNGTLAGDPNLVAVRGFTVGAAAAIHYIDPVDGDNGNDGLSPGAPKETWSAVEPLVAGDSYFQLAGTTATIGGALSWTTAATAGSPITIGRYGAGDDPIISGGGSYFVLINLSGASYISISDLRVTNNLSSGTAGAISATSGASSNITLTSVAVDTVSRHGIRVDDGEDWTITDCTITDTQQSAVHFETSTGTTINDLTVENWNLSNTSNIDAVFFTDTCTDIDIDGITANGSTSTDTIGSIVDVSGSGGSSGGSVRRVIGTGPGTGIVTNASPLTVELCDVEVASHALFVKTSGIVTAQHNTFRSTAASAVKLGFSGSNFTGTLSLHRSIGHSAGQAQVFDAQYVSGHTLTADYNAWSSDAGGVQLKEGATTYTGADWFSSGGHGENSVFDGALAFSGTNGEVLNTSAANAAGGTRTLTVDALGNAFADPTTIGAYEAGAVVSDTATGGGRGSKRAVSKYPRRIVIGGVVYWVKSAAEERRLLEEHRAKVEAEALELAITDAPAKEVAKAKVKVVRAARRLEQVDTREADWLEYLRQEDDEIVSVILH